MWFRDLVPQWDRGAALEPRVIPGSDVKAASMPGCPARPTAMRWQSHTDTNATQRQVAALGDTVIHPRCPSHYPTAPPPPPGRMGTQGTESCVLPDCIEGTPRHSSSLCVLHGPECHLALPKHPPGCPSPAAQGPWGDMTPRRPGDSSTFPGASPPSEYMATLSTTSLGPVLPCLGYCHLPGEHCHLPGHSFAFQGTVALLWGGCHLPGHSPAFSESLSPSWGTLPPPGTPPPALCRGYL